MDNIINFVKAGKNNALSMILQKEFVLNLLIFSQNARKNDNFI